MGFIKAMVGTISGELANSWKDYYTCDALPAQVLIRRGEHRTSGRSSNRRGDADVITDGSKIIVNEGQCALLVNEGQIIDVAAEPGAYDWNEGSAPTFFGGSFSDVIKEGWKRFTFGGEKPTQQRVYYVNTRELLGCKFGTPTPIPFRIVDANVGLDLDTALRCNGNYTMFVSDPVQLYRFIAGNTEDEFTVAQMAEQLRAEFVQALQPALGQLAGMGIRPSALTAHTAELSAAMQQQLDEAWTAHYGIRLTSVQILGATIPEEDSEMLKNLQRQSVYRNQAMAGAAMVDAQADAMKNAASNAGGAFMGFANMNSAMNAGGLNAGQFFNNGQQPQQNPYQAAPNGGFGAAPQQAAPNGGFGAAPQQAQQTGAPAEGVWFCPNCGTQNTGNFCPKCGTKKPEM